MVTTKQKFTASEIVLLAANDLTAAGNQEFSEWDLTVAAWNIDRFRFVNHLTAWVEVEDGAISGGADVRLRIRCSIALARSSAHERPGLIPCPADELRRKRAGAQSHR